MFLVLLLTPSAKVLDDGVGVNRKNDVGAPPAEHPDLHAQGDINLLTRLGEELLCMKVEIVFSLAKLPALRIWEISD